MRRYLCKLWINIRKKKEEYAHFWGVEINKCASLYLSYGRKKKIVRITQLLFWFRFAIRGCLASSPLVLNLNKEFIECFSMINTHTVWLHFPIYICISFVSFHYISSAPLNVQIFISISCRKSYVQLLRNEHSFCDSQLVKRQRKLNWKLNLTCSKKQINFEFETFWVRWFHLIPFFCIVRKEKLLNK